MSVTGFWRRIFPAAWLPFYFDSPDPPPPDPRIGQAAEGNVELGREALAFQKQVYEEGKPRQAMLDQLSQRVVDSALSIQAKNATAADDYLAYMRATFRPVEQRLADEAMAFDTEAKREELAGMAAADVEQAAAVSDAAARRDAARFGVNPSDGAFADNLSGTSLNKTILKVGAMNNARTQARNEGRAFKFDLAGLGRGLPGAGATASQVALQAGNNALGAGAAPAANARADAALVGSGFDQARAGTTAAGNLYAGLYDAQLRNYSAQQNEFGSFLGGVGNLAFGLGSMGLKFSSKRLKTAKRPIAHRGVLEKIKALPVERWRYRKGVADEGRHIGPYAEDVKKQFGDAAAPGGKMIDLISMNGIALAGIKALAEDVDKLKRSSVAARGVKRRAA